MERDYRKWFIDREKNAYNFLCCRCYGTYQMGDLFNFHYEVKIFTCSFRQYFIFGLFRCISYSIFADILFDVCGFFVCNTSATWLDVSSMVVFNFNYNISDRPPHFRLFPIYSPIEINLVVFNSIAFKLVWCRWKCTIDRCKYYKCSALFWLFPNTILNRYSK